MIVRIVYLIKIHYQIADIRIIADFTALNIHPAFVLHGVITGRTIITAHNLAA